MTTEEDLAYERKRVQDLRTSLVGVIEAIEMAAHAADSSRDEMAAAQVALRQATKQLNDSTAGTVRYVKEHIEGLPAAIATKIRSELDASIKVSVDNSLVMLTNSSTTLSQAAKDLAASSRKFIFHNTIAGLVSGALAGGIFAAIIVRFGRW